MKHSIAKTFTILFAVIIVLSFITVMALSYVNTYKSVYHFYRQSVKISSTTISDCAKNTIDASLSDESKFDSAKKLAKQLREEAELDYCYIYVPDEKSDTISYICCYSSEETKQLADKIMSDKVRSHTMSSEEKDVWYNKTKSAFYEYENEFGSFLVCLSPLVDKSGATVAIVASEVFTGDIYRDFLRKYVITSLVILLIFSAITVSVFIVFRAKVTNPARLISEKMNGFIKNGSADFEKIEIKGDNEFAMIGGAFNDMTDDINNYINNIKKLNENQAKQRAEIQIAYEIQKGFLPAEHFENGFYKIDAVSIPAKYIGGDFYDYFVTPDGKTALVIADVSGKGVSGAIFMARAITAIRDCANSGLNPAEILSHTNKVINANNPQMMFVTAFIGFLSEDCTHLTYSNAGHNIPYIIGKNKVTLLDKSDGVPLGMFDDESYSNVTVCLENDSTIFLYTDGVNEAVNNKNEFFGMERLQDLINDYSVKNSGNLASTLVSSLSDFTNGAEQSDDITLLALKLNKSGVCMTLKSEIKNLTVIQNLIRENTEIPKKFRLALCLIAEEVFVNICSYAYPQRSIGDVLFRLNVTDKGAVMQFEDGGVKYNPTENVITADEYDIDAQIGGLGKLISKEMSDDISYECKNNKNILTITKLFREEIT